MTEGERGGAGFVRRHRNHLIVAAIAVAAFAAYQVSGGLESIDLENLLDDVAGGLGHWTYLLVGAMAFLETGAFVGLIAPGETAVILGGAVAGRDAVDLFLMLGIAWGSAFAGDTASFFLGRRLGRAFILRHGPRVKITPERFKQVEGYFGRHGGKTIFVGRFVGLVRALAPFIAGSSGMRYGGFAPYSILGTGIWCTAFTLLGYFLSRNIERAKDVAGKGAFAVGAFIVLGVGIVVAVRFLRVPANRRRVASWMEERPVFRQLLHLGRAVGPEARFLRDRLTPGGVGLEFTTLLAMLGVAAYVVIAYAATVHGAPGPTRGDSRALDIARDLSAGWLADTARVATALAGGLVVFPLAAIAAGWLAWKGRWAECVVLVVSVVASVAAVDLLKDALDRPRPPGGLVDTSGSSYPSGHAAYAVFYLWLAVTVAFRTARGIPKRTALLTAGIAVVAVLGLTRVYLRAHWLSDVSGGWALGVAVYSLTAALAILVCGVRKNGRRDPGVGST